MRRRHAAKVYHPSRTIARSRPACRRQPALVPRHHRPHTLPVLRAGGTAERSSKRPTDDGPRGDRSMSWRSRPPSQRKSSFCRTMRRHDTGRIGRRSRFNATPRALRPPIGRGLASRRRAQSAHLACLMHCLRRGAPAVTGRRHPQTDRPPEGRGRGSSMMLVQVGALMRIAASDSGQAGQIWRRWQAEIPAAAEARPTSTLPEPRRARSADHRSWLEPRFRVVTGSACRLPLYIRRQCARQTRGIRIGGRALHTSAARAGQCRVAAVCIQGRRGIPRGVGGGRDVRRR
jgi:hypothetical protein